MNVLSTEITLWVKKKWDYLHEERVKPRVSRKKEIVKIRAEINETKGTIEKMNETESWFFEKAKLTNLSLELLKRRKREYSNKTRKERELQTVSKKYKGPQETTLTLTLKSLSRVQLFATPWTVAYQAPPPMEFSRQEYWSGLPFPSPGDLPDPGIEPRSPAL